MARDTRKHEDNRRFDLVVARETDDGKGGTARRDAALFRLLDWPDYPTVSGSLTQAEFARGGALAVWVQSACSHQSSAREWPDITGGQP